MGSRARTLTNVGLLGLGLAAAYFVLHVLWLGLQEDVHLGPRSLARFVLIDAGVRGLEVPDTLEVDGYYYTVGDGPKLPASEKLVRSSADPEQIEAALAKQLQARGFEREDGWGGEDGDAWVGEDGERVVVEILADQVPTLVRLIAYR